MIKNHIKIAFRFFKRNKLFSLINISGLALGITAFLLLVQYVNFEKSYDKGLDDVYRVTLSSTISSDTFGTSAANHPAVGPTLKTDFPAVKSYARLVNTKIMGSNGVLSYKNRSGEVVRSNTNDYNIYYAEGQLFDMFNLDFLQGNPETALKEPGSIVLSETFAKRFFGGENPVGKEIVINSEDRIKVAGVFQDLPENTHLEFDMLVSLSTLNFPLETIWAWPEFYNYVQLRPETDPNSISSGFPEFIQKYMSEIMDEYGFEAWFGLQPVGDIHLTSHLKQEMSPNSSVGTLNFLILVAAFVIGIALINFINLSTAKSLERAKEVGLKKVIGAQRGVLITQFLFESLIINFIATVVAILAVGLLIGPFNRFVGLNILSMGMWIEFEVWITIGAVFVAGGLLAGIYPAFVLSSFKPVQVLKGKFHRTGKGSMLRKGLVVTQFVVSIALISGTFIVYHQFSFMQNQELGFKADQNLVLNAPMDVDSTVQQKIDIFKKELRRNPNVNSVTTSSNIPGKALTMSDGIRKRGDEKANAVHLNFMAVDHDFLTTYKVDLLAGRDFTEEDMSQYFPYGENGDATLHPVLINEAVARALGFSEPQDAIHEKVVFKYGPAERTAKVIGVMDNYHQQSLQMGFDNIMLFYTDRYLANYLTINITGNNVNRTVSEIEAQYLDLFPRDPIKHFFLDDYFNAQYQADLKFGLICLLFSILAICIAALGLFALGTHMAMQKIKEISVRKILGATTIQALLLIPKNILKLILLSGAIALPIVYFITKNWLANYAFKIDIGLWMFIVPLFLVMVVALLAIMGQSIKTAYINPANSLRNE